MQQTRSPPWQETVTDPRWSAAILHAILYVYLRRGCMYVIRVIVKQISMTYYDDMPAGRGAHTKKKWTAMSV